MSKKKRKKPMKAFPPPSGSMLESIREFATGIGNDAHHVRPIHEHSGSKYLRTICPASGVLGDPISVDVYCVIEAYRVTCPARQHALKKLLCAGLRDKNTVEKDLLEAIDAVSRAIELEKQRTPDNTPPPNR